MIAPLRWQDGALLILDQRALPEREEWLLCTSPEQVAEAIRTLAVRGAPAIGVAAAYGLALASDFDAAAALLAATRPTAVNLAWAIARSRSRLASGGREALLAFARELHAEREDEDRRLAAFGAQHFTPGDRVLTHCNTGPLATAGYGTALGVIRAADVGQVWVDETRPLMQGARLTAYELSRAGIPYRVVTDSMAGALFAGGLVDRVVVGADRIAANGDTANKIGTYPLAVLAAHHGVPFYVAAPTSTIDPDTPTGADIPIEERAGDEITVFGGTRVAPRDAGVFNPAFDVTPAGLIAAIFTERGVLEAPYAAAIRAALSRRGPAGPPARPSCPPAP